MKYNFKCEECEKIIEVEVSIKEELPKPTCCGKEMRYLWGNNEIIIHGFSEKNGYSKEE